MMIDAQEHIEGCERCRIVATHIEALRRIVRPAKRLGERSELTVGVLIMGEENRTDEAADVLADAVTIREALTQIIATAKVSHAPTPATDETDATVDLVVEAPGSAVD